MRRVFRWIVRPSNPTLALVVAILVLAAVVATGTGFWLLFRLSYVLAFALPVTWLIAWYNTRGLQVRVDYEAPNPEDVRPAVELYAERQVRRRMRAMPGRLGGVAGGNPQGEANYGNQG